MSARKVPAWDRYAGYRPGPAEEWRYARTRAEILTELELCSVPLNATPTQACALLETNGVWAIPPAVKAALRARRENAVQAK